MRAIDNIEHLVAAHDRIFIYLVEAVTQFPYDRQYPLLNPPHQQAYAPLLFIGTPPDVEAQTQ